MALPSVEDLSLTIEPLESPSSTSISRILERQRRGMHRGRSLEGAPERPVSPCSSLLSLSEYFTRFALLEHRKLCTASGGLHRRRVVNKQLALLQGSNTCTGPFAVLLQAPTAVGLLP